MSPEPASVLLAHNFYQQPGGEDQVFAAECRLLAGHSHEVARFEEHNASIGGLRRLAIGATAAWNPGSLRRLRHLLRERRPQVVHFHNTFPLISPAAYYAARAAGAAVVQTLHNYRLLCPAATLFRDGAVCEECLVRHSLWPAVTHACYRQSRAATAATAAMLAIHRRLGTWSRMVDVYIALSEFARKKFVEGGLPAEKIMVKPNFVDPDPGAGEGRGEYALFVGRLAEEKGVRVLLEAWRDLPDVPLRIAGDGPLAVLNSPPGVTRLGPQPHAMVAALLKDARVLICPSVWYESAPLTILEAFAAGVPVIAAGLGVMPELVADRRNGRLFRPGDAVDLAAQVRWAWDQPVALQSMRREARADFERHYTAEQNYARLMQVYQSAIERAARAPESSLKSQP